MNDLQDSLERLKAKTPLKDPSLWLAIAAGLMVFAQGGSGTEATAPVMAWLLAHGYIRGKGAGAAGEVMVLGSRATETVYPADAVAGPDIMPGDHLESQPVDDPKSLEVFDAAGEM